ncbi:hypothetical protein ACTXT7_002741 [Hymenolepis weldensis]
MSQKLEFRKNEVTQPAPLVIWPLYHKPIPIHATLTFVSRLLNRHLPLPSSFLSFLAAVQ